MPQKDITKDPRFQKLSSEDQADVLIRLSPTTKTAPGTFSAPGEGLIPRPESVELPTDLPQMTSRFLAGALPAVGATAGGFATGGLGGQIAGGAVGTGLEALLQGVSPEFFGQPPQGPGEAIERFGKDALLNALFGGMAKGASQLGTKGLLASSIAGGAAGAAIAPEDERLQYGLGGAAIAPALAGGGKFLADKLATSFIRLRPDYADAVAGASKLNMPLSLADLAEGSATKQVSNLLASGPAKKLRDTQLMDVQKGFANRTGLPERIAGAVKKNIKRGFKEARQAARGAWKDVIDSYNTATNTGDLIKFPEAQKLAGAELVRLLDVYKGVSKQGNIVGTDIAELVTPELRPVVEALQVVAKGGNITLEAAKNVQNVLGKMSKFEHLIPSFQEGTYRTLRDATQKDISQSLFKIDPILEQKFLTANAATKESYERFGKKQAPTVFSILVKKEGNVGRIKGILSEQSTEKIDQVLKAAKNIPEAKRDLAALAITEIFDQTFKGGKLNNPLAGVEAMTSPSKEHIWRKLLLPNRKNNLTNFFKTVEAVGSEPGSAGKLGLAIRVVPAGIALAAWGKDILSGEQTNLPLYATGLLGISLGGRAFAKHVLLNPSLVKDATKLASFAAGSPEAMAIQKKILLAMRGTQATLSTPDGPKKAKITKDGKLELAK